MVHRKRLMVILGLALLCLAWAVPVYADTHEVDMPYTSYDPLCGDGLCKYSRCKLGQWLVIPDRYVIAIGYHVWKIGDPTGNVTFSIYNATTNRLMLSKVWGDASNLTTWGSGGYQVVALDEPIRISGEVKLCVEYYGGDWNNYCVAGYYTGDMIAGESYVNYRYNQWINIGEAEEGSYHYTWIDEEDLKTERPVPSWIAVPIALAVGGVWFYANKKQHKGKQKIRNEEN